MSTEAIHSIRNILLAGHASCGKTTLAEALLAASGTIKTAGCIENGTTVSDHDELEKASGHSLDTSVLHLETEGIRIHLLDTPGTPDLANRALSVFSAAETAAVVIDAHHGIEPVTERAMLKATQSKLDRLIIVNKIDIDDFDPAALLADIQERFGPECLPLNLPAEGGKRVVDCFFKPEYDTETDVSSVRTAHDAMVDQVVEMDEALMEVYLEQGSELSPDQLHDPFEAALRDDHLVPICFVSAKTGAGIDLLLETFRRLMPDPTEGHPPEFLKGEGEDAKPIIVAPDPNAHALGHVFKITNDPYKGKLAVFRVHQGTINLSSQLFIGDARKPFRVQHLFRLQGGDRTEIDTAVPGDICAVARVDDIHFDAVLHDSHDEDNHHLKHIPVPSPVAGVALEASQRGAEQKLSTALHKILDEDPCLALEQARGEMVLRGLGQTHLKVVLDRLQSQYGIEVSTHEPSVPYRETITAKAEGHHRHKKQTGGAGQFGEVWLRIEPLDNGGGFEFVDAIVGGVIPKQLIPAVEKGIREALEEGVVAGFPIHDVRATLYDGKTHPVDSKEVAFHAAGKKAFQQAIAAAKPVILEPIASLKVTAPADAMGSVSADLSGRRGRVLGTEHISGGRVRITADAPLAELRGYESALKSMSGGQGRYTMEFDRYERLPGDEQRRLLEAAAN